MSSLYKVLMDFFKTVTIAELAEATNAPQYVTEEDGSMLDPQNVVPLDYVDSVGVLKDPHLDYVFYLVSPTDSDIAAQVDITTDGASEPSLQTRTTQYVRNFRAEWQIYGDDALEWADTLRLMLLSDPSIHDMLKAQGISVILPIDQAVFFPEKINQQWFHRYDLHAEFNQIVTFTAQVPVISGTQIIIESQKGVEATCST